MTWTTAIQKWPSDPRRMLSGLPGRSTNVSAVPAFSPFSHTFMHLNLRVFFAHIWLALHAIEHCMMIRVKVQLPGGLADDHEGLVPRQGDAVGEAEAVEHDGRLAAARVVPEEAAGGAGL